MYSLQNRATALENKFAHEEEFMFKARARRNNLLGLWAAAIIGKGDAKAYAADITLADIANPDGVFDRLRQDFDAAGVTVLDDDIRSRMSCLLKEVSDAMYRGR